MSFHKKDGVYAVRIFFLNCKKLAQQQIDIRAVAHLAHHVLQRTLMQSMIWW